MKQFKATLTANERQPLQKLISTGKAAAKNLMHTLDLKGESGAAALLQQLGGVGENARDLAYPLYTLCESK